MTEREESPVHSASDPRIWKKAGEAPLHDVMGRLQGLETHVKLLQASLDALSSSLEEAQRHLALLQSHPELEPVPPEDRPKSLGGSDGPRD